MSRHRKTQEEYLTGPVPRMYQDWGEMERRVTMFPWKEGEITCPSSVGYARICWKMSWTALALWDGSIYFADTIILFDEMMELIRKRFEREWPAFEIERENG